MIADLTILVLILFLSWWWLKLNLYLLYIWQNYEYRLDRLKAYLHSARFRYDGLDCINPIEVYLIRRPHFTLKVIFLWTVILYVNLVIWAVVIKPLATLINANNQFFLAAALTIGLLLLVTPLVSGLIVFLVH